MCKWGTSEVNVERRKIQQGTTVNTRVQNCMCVQKVVNLHALFMLSIYVFIKKYYH